MIMTGYFWEQSLLGKNTTAATVAVTTGGSRYNGWKYLMIAQCYAMSSLLVGEDTETGIFVFCQNRL